MRATSFQIVAALALAALAACGQRTPAREPASAPPPAAARASASPSPKLERGLDVSSFSGSVDWSAVRAAGYDFAIARASEGITITDESFEAHWAEMKKAGIVRGAYHFFVTNDDPDTQARSFIERVHLEPGDLAPIVDIEHLHDPTPPGLADRLRRWLEVVEEHYGVRPVIYTSPNFWDANLDGSFGHHPLWIAEYGVEAPRLPTGWSDWHLWQWKGGAEVDGVEHDADLDHVNREGVDLSALLVPVSPPG